MNVKDLDVKRAISFCDYFVECCKWGAGVGLNETQLSAVLAAYTVFLSSNGRPLQYYVDNPKGTNPNALTQDVLDRIVARHTASKETV
jgi:hypothetical protein